MIQLSSTVNNSSLESALGRPRGSCGTRTALPSRPGQSRFRFQTLGCRLEFPEREIPSLNYVSFGVKELQAPSPTGLGAKCSLQILSNAFAAFSRGRPFQTHLLASNLDQDHASNHVDVRVEKNSVPSMQSRPPLR